MQSLTEANKTHILQTIYHLATVIMHYSEKRTVVVLPVCIFQLHFSISVIFTIYNAPLLLHVCFCMCRGGCGQHVDSALASVPLEQRCPCKSRTQAEQNKR